MTRCLAIIAAARADIRLHERLVDLACMAGVIVIIQVGMVLAGYQEKLV